MNFWQKLKKPIMMLAPMEDVTDTVFRQIVIETGRPDVFFTEFTSTDALCSSGKLKVIDRFQFTDTERPLVAQIWGNKPENFYQAAKIAKQMNFDGIDINMGCPVKNMVKIGACAALIKNPGLAQEIIQATKDGGGNLPVSVKTRIGYNSIDTENWVTTLLQTDIAALTIHARTAREKSQVPAHWEEIGKAVKIRNALNSNTLIIGNGDITSLIQAQEMVKQYQVDGVMIGRGIFHNIWFFNPRILSANQSLKDRLALLTKHVNLFEQTWGNNKHYAILKKFYKVYLTDFSGAAEMRAKFMQTTNFAEVKELIKRISPSK